MAEVANIDYEGEVLEVVDEEAREFSRTANEKAAEAQTNLSEHTANTSNPHGVTKAQVGLSNVDNTADANKPVSTAQAAAIADAKAAGTTAQAAAEAAQSTADTATNIAKGRNQAHVFNTTADMQAWLSNAANKGLWSKGDNIYIVELDVPDWWVAEVLTTADPDTGYYYKIAQLETQKVDLTTIEAELDTKVTNNFTANRAVFSGAEGKLITSGTVTSTELGYLDGVTSNIQTQLNDKLNKGGHAVNKAVVTDGNGNIAPTGITSAEIGTLSGVTSNIQTQLNGKATLGGQPNFQGIHVGEAGAVGYIYPGGTDGNIWFRYQNASGGTHYTNMRTIVRGSLSGTTLTLEIG